MRYWFYTLYVVVMGILILILDVTLGKLYVRYMVLLTGTIFMLGMLVGEGKERRWAKRQQEQPLPEAPESFPAARPLQPVGRRAGSMTVSEVSE